MTYHIANCVQITKAIREKIFLYLWTKFYTNLSSSVSVIYKISIAILPYKHDINGFNEKA